MYLNIEEDDSFKMLKRNILNKCISIKCEGLFKGCCKKEHFDSSKTEYIDAPIVSRLVRL